MKINKRKILFVIGDFILLYIAIYAAVLLRFDADIPPGYMNNIKNLFILACLVNIPMFYLFGLYSRLWVYASIEELIQLFLATVAGMLAEYIGSIILNIDMPRSVYIISWFITFILVGGLRFSYRLFKKLKGLKHRLNPKKRIMVVGAGDAGSMLIKEIKSSKKSIYDPVVAIDDDVSKHGTKINGVLIVGGRDKIVSTAHELYIDEILIALPSIPKKEVSSIVKICKQTPCKLKVLPGVYNIVNGEVGIKEIRDVNIEDLLARDKIDLNTEEIAQYLKDEVILVTGGGGSIGSEICRQVLKYDPKMLLIFDIYENNAYELHNELLSIYDNKDNIRVIIGSIRDEKRLEQVFVQYKPTVVFHAAAHKHVPLMEENPLEAIKNNVFGTLNVVQCAHQYNSKKFVLISTDKAVNPTNIMGATKRIAEMLIQYMDQRSDTVYTAVRFGNVLGSNGSVIPLFQKQIQNGGPVTVTHHEITRFFMTIPEASSLVIQAGAMAAGGEIFVLDMGEPIKIADLVKSLIEMYGLEPGVDIEVKYTGLRPGEKLYEELLMTEDGVVVTKNDKILIEKNSKVDFDLLMEEIDKIRDKEFSNVEEIKDFIKKVVPTYSG
ncbi:MAG TPA: nucleoside-diphosphate sugar epimerase/dehydratase [Pseudobacteroides sp.]|nr:nucleoside-diphosphate sugar epimerase/dehydratase [Pseudobacteroides sp.]